MTPDKSKRGKKKESQAAPESDRATLVDVNTAEAITPKSEPFLQTTDGEGADRESEAHGGDDDADTEDTNGRASATESAGDGEEPGTEVEQARELSRSHLRGLLEALVFASDKPMKNGELAHLASAPAKQVRELMSELAANYADRGIVLDEVAGGWLFRTNAQYAPFVRELAGGRPVKLTRAQIETLAITAYRQPITRPEIDEIRGVDSGATLKLLLERDLVRILGKKDEPGRPLLYGTTTHFLEFFNMKSLKDLPTLREFTELSDESRRVAEAELEGGFEPPPKPDPDDTQVIPNAAVRIEEAAVDAGPLTSPTPLESEILEDDGDPIAAPDGEG